MTNRLRHIFQTLFPRPAAPPTRASSKPSPPEAPARAGLNDIDWPSLHHAYGPATDVPDLLRALASPDEESRRAAVYELYGNIWHQGTVYEATPHAAPFLIRLLADPATPDRPDLLGLLDALANGRHKEFGEATRLAVAKGFDHYVRLLDDPDWRVRAGAVNLLVSIPDVADALLDRHFHRRADVETHVLVRCTLWLGFVTRDICSPTLDRLTHALIHAPDVRERYAAACALVRPQGKDAPDDALHLVAAFARDEWIADVILNGLPWDWAAAVNPEALADCLDTTPEALANLPADRAPADPISTYTVPLVAATTDEHEAPGLAAALIFVAFPNAQPLTDSPWNDRQRQAIRAIVDSDVLWQTPRSMAFLHGRGLKSGPGHIATDREQLRNLLEQNDKR